jgi:hypothetical protein
MNLFAAAWVQFLIHDWFDHGHPCGENPIKVPLESDDPLYERLDGMNDDILLFQNGCLVSCACRGCSTVAILLGRSNEIFTRGHNIIISPYKMTTLRTPYCIMHSAY